MAAFYSFNRTFGGAILAIALMALASSGVLFVTFGNLSDVTAERGAAFRVIAALDSFRTAMLNQETGVRGYLLTGETTSLEPYYAGKSAFDSALQTLHDLIHVKGSGEQTASLADAETAARAWQHEIGEAVVADMQNPATRDTARDLESHGAGKRYFDGFRLKLNAIQRAQRQMLDAQDALLARAQRNATIALVVSTLFIVVMCLVVGVAVRRYVAEPLTRLAEAMRRLSQRDLSADIPALRQRNEVGAMARAVEVFKNGLIELDRTSLLRATADTLPAMVGYVDNERRVGFLNNEFGRWFDLPITDVADASGQPLYDVFTQASFPGAGKELETALSGRETRFEQSLARRGASLRDVEAIFRPHVAPNGRVLGVVTLLTDITERKTMERRLAKQTRDLLQTNEELEQFAYVASHDLKAPLRGIDNLVTWIEEDLTEALQGDTRTNMDLLKNRVRRLENLLDDLLAYSRAGRTDATAEDVDTAQLVADLAILVSPPEGMQISGGSDLPTIHAARAPLTQALQNLIGNAIKHHDRPAAGHIQVDGRLENQTATFSVTDDGPGIPKQFHERVFGMFQTLRPRDEVEGSGMGLAIVKKLVERQGGRVWLGEGRDGRGLSVNFTWPVGARLADTRKDGA